MVVANSSPLISLSSIGSLHLLNQLYATIHIPEAVWREVVIEGRGRPGAKDVAEADWIKRQRVKDKRQVKNLAESNKLKGGEAEAIILAIELKAEVIILDERPARRVACEKYLSVIGTLGVLLQSKRKKLLPSVKTPLDALIAAGLRINPAVYQTILRSAGE